MVDQVQDMTQESEKGSLYHYDLNQQFKMITLTNFSTTTLTMHLSNDIEIRILFKFEGTHE